CSVPPIQRARLERLAVTDDLTLAFNSRYLAVRVPEEMERARRTEAALSMLLMALDHFKRVHDTYGHDVGDQWLRRVAGPVRCAASRSRRRGGPVVVRDPHAVLVNDPRRVARGDARAGEDDAHEVQRVARAHADDLAGALGAAHPSERVDGVGEGELLAQE